MKRVVICLVLFLFAFSFAYAEEVSIEVETLPNHDLVIAVLDASQGYNLLDSTKVSSDSEGKVKVAFTINRNLVDVGITLNKDGSKILYERFEDYDPNEVIDLKIIPGGYIGDASDDPDAVVEEEFNVTNLTLEEEVNETVESNETVEEIVEEEIVSENTSVDNNAITGNVASGLNTSIVQNWTYIAGVIFVVVALLVVVFGRRLINHPAAAKVVGAVTPNTSNSKPADSDDDPRIVEAEKKIKEAQKELKQIRNESKIKEAEKKLKEDQARLEKLKRGESD